MNIISKKTLIATIGAVALAATFAVSSTPASAGWHGHRGAGIGLGIGAGLLGAAIVGSAIASSRPAYAAPVYGGGCEIQRRPIRNGWGEVVGFRPVRVCY
jgi:hypothetical protein